MAGESDKFKSALVGKKIPILTLDNKWHRLFTKSEFTQELKGLEQNLNDSLKRQAKLVSETKEIKKLKKKLMDDVVLLAGAMGENPTKKQDKEMSERKRLIEECSEKLDAYEEELSELPRQINQLNNQIMLITMDVCYRKLKQSTKELSEIDEWIGNIRRELKKKVVRKKEKEAVISRLYGYMHDIFGAQVLGLFDLEYDPESKYHQKAQDLEEAKEAKQKEAKSALEKSSKAEAAPAAAAGEQGGLGNQDSGEAAKAP